MSPDMVFTLFYLLLSACIIYPPTEFVSAGFTIPQFFSRYLGFEEEQFIAYHIRKSILNLLIYSLLPLGYVLSLIVLGFSQEVTLLFISGTYFWKVFSTTSVILPLLALYIIKSYSDNNYERHPIAENISKFCNNNTNWRQLSKDIDAEFRSIDKICIQTNTLTKIIATENWVMKVTPLTIFFAHQSDATLIVKEANNFQISVHNNAESQYLNIDVKSRRPNVEPFIIRINVVDFKDLQDRIGRQITVPENVKFHKTIIDKFVDVFKETIKSNARYEFNRDDLDMCIGCLQTRSNIKLQKLCEDSTRANCTTCYCRPMWCANCMAKWFASRQDSEQQHTWLSSKCTCPMCRATFCILDVCFIKNSEDDEDVEE